MKKSYLNSIALGVLCAGALLIGTLTQTAFAAAQAGGDAHLTITRSPTLGSGTAISVLVDGQKVGTVQSGNRYNGSISAGKHTVSVRFEPLSTADKPAIIEVNAVAGQTYSFSATIKSGAITLQKNR
jgi:hypothetical protein